MVDVTEDMVPYWESFTEVSSSNTGPENREVGATFTKQCSVT